MDQSKFGIGTFIRASVRFLPADESPRSTTAWGRFECLHKFDEPGEKSNEFRMGTLVFEEDQHADPGDTVDVTIFFFSKEGDEDLMQEGREWRLFEHPSRPFAVGTVLEVLKIAHHRQPVSPSP